MKDTPKEVRDDFEKMMEAVIDFTASCKKHGITPRKCYAGIATCFLGQFSPAENQLVRDIVVIGTATAFANWMTPSQKN